MKINTNREKSGSNNYLLDVKIIDEQHQKFLNIIDCIVKFTHGNESADQDKINKFLNELSDYAKFHFITEEKLLMLAHYSDIGKHIKEHIFYIDKIDEFIFARKYNNPVLLENMLAFLKRWFLSHIMHTDAKYIDNIIAYLKDNPFPE